MSIDQSDVIDLISTTPEGKVVVTISDHLDWKEHNHLLLLQDKINKYLQFIQSGQIYEDYPHAVNREISIRTVTKYEPSAEATEFLGRCKEIINDAGIGFEWRTLEKDD